MEICLLIIVVLGNGEKRYSNVEYYISVIMHFCKYCIRLSSHVC